MKKHILLFPLIILCLSESFIYSQQEGWSILNLGHNITTNNKYAVGGTCLIFAENSSRTIFGFNINSGKWSSTTVSTTLPWTEVYSHGNTAMILNDSMAVFYSGLNGNFATLRYEGQKINLGTKWVGCKENYGYLVTDTKIYFFDAEDSQIRSLTYTGVGTSSPGGGIHDYSDYFCMNIWNTVPVAHTLVAYSPVTKTVSEYTLGALAASGASFEFLDHGFVVNSIGGPPYYGLGYSAYTGNFTIKTSNKYDIIMTWPSCDPVSVNKRLCCLFRNLKEIDVDGIAYVTLWAYNTLSGTFDEFNYSYHYNNTHIVPDAFIVGGEGALHSLYDKDNGNKVNVIIYNAYTHTFSQHDFNCSGRNAYYFGGHVIAITTTDKLIFYDLINGTVSNHNSDWQAGQFPRVISIKPGNEYVVTVYRDPAETDITKFKILSFNGSTGLIKSVSYTPQSYYSTVFAAGNYSTVFLTNSTQSNSNIIYSAAQDKWIIKSLTTGVTYGYKNALCYHRYKNESIIEIFDAKTGNETTIPVNPYNEYQSALVVRDSILGMLGTDLKLYGFSSFNNSLASTSSTFYSNSQSERIIFYYSTVTTPVNHLLFDADLGKFVPLSTTDLIHGTGIHIAAGMKTALRVCSKGYLFAYNPNSVGNGEAPLVNATASQYSGDAPLTVEFNAEITGGNAPVSISWNFGDGSTSTTQNPIHSFISPGTYIATVTVTDTDADTGICSLVITITDASTAIEKRLIYKPKVYPTPAGDRITLDLPEGVFSGDFVQIYIFDLSGKCVKDETAFDLSGSPFTLDIAELPQGIYILQLTDNRINHKIKIIKVR